jgi:hypothetical protein
LFWLRGLSILCILLCIGILRLGALELKGVCPNHKVGGKCRAKLDTAGWKIQNLGSEGSDQLPFFRHLTGEKEKA